MYIRKMLCFKIFSFKGINFTLKSSLRPEAAHSPPEMQMHFQGMESLTCVQTFVMIKQIWQHCTPA